MRISVLFLFFLPLLALSQEETYPEAIINWRFIDDVEIYSMPNGNLVSSMHNDHENQNYLSLKILTETGDYFYVEMTHSVYGKSRTGWIKKSEHIGAFSRNDAEIQNLSLFSNPHATNSKIRNLTGWQSGFITIEKCQNNWRYVSLIYKEEKVSGWIEADKLCATNTSSCL
jgi:hypothetical protein